MSDEKTKGGDVINITNPMNLEEAKQCLAKIKTGFTKLNTVEHDIRQSCLMFKRREGWRAMGYKSMTNFAEKAIGQSKTTFYRLLEAEQAAEEIRPSLNPSGQKRLDKATTNAISEVAKLNISDKDKAKVIGTAAEIADEATDKVVDAGHVRKAITKLKKDGDITIVGKPKPAKKEEAKPAEQPGQVDSLVVLAEKLQRAIDGLDTDKDPLGHAEMVNSISRIVALLQTWGQTAAVAEGAGV